MGRGSTGAITATKWESVVLAFLQRTRRAHVKQIIQECAKYPPHVLGEADYAELDSGGPRWKKNVLFFSAEKIGFFRWGFIEEFREKMLILPVPLENDSNRGWKN